MTNHKRITEKILNEVMNDLKNPACFTLALDGDRLELYEELYGQTLGFCKDSEADCEGKDCKKCIYDFLLREE